MSLQSIFCRHTWYWSERHRADRCRQCGKLAGDDPGLADAAPAAEAAAPEILSPSRPFQLGKQTHRRSLQERLDMLADGQRLSQDEVLETVVDLIEEAQTARPRLSADDAARYFAALDGARRQHA